jgi:inorganic triphosphatase YgiF
MATELELKLHLTNAELIKDIVSDAEIRSYMREEFKETEMHARYYDTPDWDLYKAGYMLRIRSENERILVSLKKGRIDNEDDNGLCVRKKWMCETPDIENSIANLVADGAPKEIASLTAGKPLVNICRDDFTRTSAILYMEEGVVVELSMDVGTTHAGDKEGPILEMELEVLAGSLVAMQPFCRALGERYGLMPETTTKYEKSYALACG